MGWTVYNSDGQILQGSATLADDSVDSQHYAAASIDNEHLADDAVGVDELAANAVVNASIASAAQITFDKMVNLTTGRLLVSDGSGDVSVSAVTAAEILLLSGLSSNVTDTNLNALTAGSGDTSLHTHAGGGPSQASQTEAETRDNEDKYIPPDLMRFVPGVGMCKTIGSNVSITSDTTYTGESEWTFPVEANHNYAMQALFIINSSSTADFKMKFVGPSGASGYWNYCCYGLEANSGLVKQGFMHNMASDEITPLNGAAALYAFHLWGFATVSSTAGNVVFQWAQGTSESVPTVLWANSVMEMHNADIPNF